MQPFSFLNHQPTQNLIGRYVAIGMTADWASGVSVYSDDKGITWSHGAWTTRAPSTVSTAFGNGVYLAAFTEYATSKTWASASIDGITFNEPVEIPFSGFYTINSLVFMENIGRWVVSLGLSISSSSTSQYATSDDNGESWQIRTMPKSSSWSAAYGNGKIVASNVTNASNNIAYSVDGISWTSQSFNQTRLFSHPSYLPSALGGVGTYILNGSAGNPRSALAQADTAIPSWSAPSTGTAPFFKTVGCAPFKIGSPVSCWTINQGSTSWRYGIDTARTNPQNSLWESIATDNDITADKSFVAVASSGARRIARTTGSNDFTLINDPALNSLIFYDVAFGEVV